MKHIRLFSSLFTGLMLFAHSGEAQNGYIYTPVSNYVVGFSGDGAHASEAQFSYIYGVTTDKAGNLYVGDEMNYRIRKIDLATGIVTTIAGTGTQGYSGDGGPAINANINGSFNTLCANANGDLYFYDGTAFVIRKIDGSTGIITTFAGNGNNYSAGNGGLAINAAIETPQGLTITNNHLYIATNCRVRKIDLATDTITAVAGNGFAGYTGDGGPAVNATLGYLFGIAGDAYGNIYIPDNTNHVIRKVDANTGIITTICGTGQSGMAIDNIPAITAQLDEPWDIEIDMNGNLLIADFGNGRIRRIDMATGIINNVAGFGTYIGSTDEAVPALSARVDPRYLCVDKFNNIYFTQSANSVRKITVNPPAVNIASDSFSVQAFHECNNTQFVARITTYDVAPYSIKTYYGNGQDNTHGFVQRQQVEGTSVFDYSYPISGSYPVKHVLYNGSNPIDSIQYQLQYNLCRSVSANVFLDGNSDCAFDPNTESSLSQAATIRVDSNNVVIDTVSVLGKFTYHTFGNIGDVYKFTVLDLPLGVQSSCLNGVFTDTIQTTTYTGTHDLGTECGTGSAFDLSVNAHFTGTGTAADADIIVHNTYCNAQNATITMTFSPKYEFQSAYPVPTTQNNNIITWVLTPGDFSDYNAYLHVSLNEANSQIVMPGDTVHTQFSVTPTTGDSDPSNNAISMVDTVTGPYDPNAIYVSPEGCITPGANLTYTLTFENMGNDTAHSIYVMDTLNNNVDMQTLQVISSSHAMNVIKISTGTHNIVRFEFPGINLPDSSHHDLCHGMVIYTVNSATAMSLTDIVTNKAGIFFDYMPAVLTNVTETPVCQPQSVNTTSGKIKLHIFPNPANSELTIQGHNSITSCTVLSQAGQAILHKNIEDGKATLDISKLPAGLYFLNVRGANGNEVHKFIKM